LAAYLRKMEKEKDLCKRIADELYKLTKDKTIVSYHFDLTGHRPQKTDVLNRERGHADLTVHTPNGIMHFEIKRCSPYTSSGKLKSSEHINRQYCWLENSKRCAGVIYAGFAWEVDQIIKVIDAYGYIGAPVATNNRDTIESALARAINDSADCYNWERVKELAKSAAEYADSQSR
jgi:hypothetical protein